MVSQESSGNLDLIVLHGMALWIWGTLYMYLSDGHFTAFTPAGGLGAALPFIIIVTVMVLALRRMPFGKLSLNLMWVWIIPFFLTLAKI